MCETLSFSILHHPCSSIRRTKPSRGGRPRTQERRLDGEYHHLSCRPAPCLDPDPDPAHDPSHDLDLDPEPPLPPSLHIHSVAGKFVFLPMRSGQGVDFSIITKSWTGISKYATVPKIHFLLALGIFKVVCTVRIVLSGNSQLSLWNFSRDIVVTEEGGGMDLTLSLYRLQS